MKNDKRDMRTLGTGKGLILMGNVSTIQKTFRIIPNKNKLQWPECGSVLKECKKGEIRYDKK